MAATRRLDFTEWSFQVDGLARVHLMCSWADLCGDMEPLRRAYADGETPLEFLRWWADKYDLDWYHEGEMI